MPCFLGSNTTTTLLISSVFPYNAYILMNTLSPKPKILVVDPIHNDALTLLEEEGFLIDTRLFPALSELPKIVQNYDILICRTNTKLSSDFFNKVKNLTCVALASTGYDQIDLESAEKNNIPILGLPSSNKSIDVTKHGNFISTAEHTFMLILAALNDFYNASASMKSGQWEKPKFMGKEAYQKTLGIIGFGRIAKLVTTRAHAFGMSTIAYDPHVSETEMDLHSTKKVSLETLCQESDVITIHAPKTPDTTHLLNERTFLQMKKGVILVNAARSEIVEKTALIQALENGTVLRVAMDVFTNEPYDVEWDLVQHEKIIPTPHIAGSTEEAQRRIALTTAQSIIDFIRHGDTANVINYNKES